MTILRKFLNWYARLAPGRGPSLPPYQHVIQIGDPALRRPCETVPIVDIKSEKIQLLIKKLENVLNKYGSVGMSAPQIGVNLRIFAMRHTAKQIADTPKESANSIRPTVVPFTVFVNPSMKVLDFQKVVHNEGCESVRGFSAEVARYKKVEIRGYNQNGEPINQVFQDWAARIAQHEFDHLDGKIYTDIMDRKTLACSCWEEVNLSKGKVVIPFMPE